jgi:hypothetical protein
MTAMHGSTPLAHPILRRVNKSSEFIKRILDFYSLPVLRVQRICLHGKLSRKNLSLSTVKRKEKAVIVTAKIYESASE